MSREGKGKRGGGERNEGEVLKREIGRRCTPASPTHGI